MSESADARSAENGKRPLGDSEDVPDSKPSPEKKMKKQTAGVILPYEAVLEEIEHRTRVKGEKGVIFSNRDKARKNSTGENVLNSLVEHCDHNFRGYEAFAEANPNLKPYLVGEETAVTINVRDFLDRLPHQRLLAACSEPLSSPNARNVVFQYCLHSVARESLRNPETPPHKRAFAYRLLAHLLVEPKLSKQDVGYIQDLCPENLQIQLEVFHRIDANEATKEAAWRKIQARTPELVRRELNPNAKPDARMLEEIRGAKSAADLEKVLDHDPEPEVLSLMLTSQDPLLHSPQLHRILGNISHKPYFTILQQLARSTHCDQELMLKLVSHPGLLVDETYELNNTVRRVLTERPELKKPEMLESMVRRCPNIEAGHDLDLFSWILDEKPPKEVKRALLAKDNQLNEIMSRLAGDVDPEILDEVSKKFENNVYVLCALASNPLRSESERDESIRRISIHLRNSPEIKNSVMSYVAEKYPGLRESLFAKEITFRGKTYRLPIDFRHPVRGGPGPGGDALIDMNDRTDITDVIEAMHKPKIIPYVAKKIENCRVVVRPPYPPPQSAASFFVKEKVDVSPSLTALISDQSSGKTRFLHGEYLVPKKMEEIHEKFVRHINDLSFPCIAAKSAFRHGSNVVGIYQKTLCTVKEREENAKNIVSDLQKYMPFQDVFLDKGNPFVTFVAIFSGHGKAELENVEELLNKQIVSCEKIIGSQRSGNTSRSRDRRFIIARLQQFEYPGLVFNGEAQIDLLYKNRALPIVQRAIEWRKNNYHSQPQLSAVPISVADNTAEKESIVSISSISVPLHAGAEGT